MEQRQTGYMRKMLMTALLLACAWAGAAGYEMRSYVALDGKTQEAFVWCDAPQTVLALTMPTKIGPNQDGVPQADLLMWNKNHSRRPALNRVSVGPPDPGAGQIYQSLKVTSGPRKGQSGFWHTSNIENVQDPAYRMTKTGEFKLGNSVYTCRYVPQAAFMGVTSKRTVIIWDMGDVVTYATRNFDGSAGVYVTEGRKTVGAEGGIDYEFKTASGFSYSVMIDEYRPAPGAKLTVYKAKNLKMSETFVAYSVSLPKTSK